jgi:transcriptional regulator
MNCYAPLEYKPGGATQIKMSAAKNKTENSISLNEKEWSNIVDRIVQTMRNFETVNSPQQFELHKKHTWKPDVAE